MLYLHVTTHIEGHPNDNLFREFGFTGFPSFGYLDAAGELIARHAGDRSCAGFDTTGNKAKAYLEMRKRAQDGDATAGQHVFVQDLGLGRYTFSTGSRAFEARQAGMSETLRQRARQSLTDLQYAELTAELRGRLPKLDRQEYSRRYNELNVQFFRADRIPSGYRATGMLATVMRAAKDAGDAGLFEKALERYKAQVAGQPRYARAIEMYGKQLEELRK